ncbi:hypothetical protein, partial [Schaalia canis]|uniref:hypothetical protein n=1 Tax=Schaalia canis TaxID=100469 RepID=UPI0014020B8E
DWRVTPLDFGEGIAAFQAVYWEGKGLTPPPPEPVVEEGGFIRTTARAYGIVDDTYIMVRIDLKNVSVEPPSEEELRALWDAQVAKVRYFKAIERSEEVLTPQSGQTSK